MAFRLPLVLVILSITSLAGCATVGSSVSVSSVSRPMPAATAQVATSRRAPQIPEGSDFSTAVALLAQTEGSGVVAVNGARPSSALALVEEKPTKKPKKPKPSKKAAVAAALEAPPAPVTKPAASPDCSIPTVPPLPYCASAAVTTAFGDPIVPVQRF